MKRPMNLNLSRRDILLILGFWLVSCVLLGLIFYYVTILIQPPPPLVQERVYIPQATFTVQHTQNTAKSMQQAIDAQIALWQTDAQLYSIAATWDKTDLGLVGQPTAWTYRFYSPGQKRLYFVTANPDGEVTGTSHSERVYNAPNPIPIENWQVDSSEAINMWLNYGGATMLTAIPGIQVVTQLQVRTPGAPLTWTVSGFDRISKHYHTVFIDAKTKEVIKIESSLNR